MFACSESESLLEGGREGGRDDGPLWCLSPKNLANSARLWEPCTRVCSGIMSTLHVLHHHGMGSAVNMPNCTPGSRSEWDKRLLQWHVLPYNYHTAAASSVTFCILVCWYHSPTTHVYITMPWRLQEYLPYMAIITMSHFLPDIWLPCDVRQVGSSWNYTINWPYFFQT